MKPMSDEAKDQENVEEQENHDIESDDSRTVSPPEEQEIFNFEDLQEAYYSGAKSEVERADGEELYPFDEWYKEFMESR